MLSFVVRSGRLEPCQKPLPRVRPGWALVRVRLAGICNTDLELLRGYHNFRGTPGHEFVGEVVRVGAAPSGSKRGAIRKRWLGRRVVGEINIACAALGRRELCSYCRRSVPTHCLRRCVMGIVAHDGAFAEYVCLPLGNLHAVPSSVSDEQAVFTEPLAAACEILEQVPVGEHREAAVLGDGKLAQLVARVLRVAGLRVVMLGKHPEKLALARQAGISAVRASPARRAAQPRNSHFSLVVEATGSPEGFKEAQRLTAPRGTLVLKSTFHGTTPVETWPIVVNELRLVGSRCGSFLQALKLLRAGRVDPRPLVSRTFPLNEAPAAIRYAQRSGVLKVLLRPTTENAGLSPADFFTSG
ncbi:MAG TPA: alcohol dehydrogenase catalytic domain-containing protein [Candidatus Acidoferrales bacterium]|nr:alcohol dehydrogenase catalytic domain-containing protein [Candidatus Acidoferrales bacterium]